MTRHLENKKPSSVRVLVNHAQTPVNGGGNCDRKSVWKWKAEGGSCIGNGDELVDVASWVGFEDVISANRKLVRHAGTRHDQRSFVVSSPCLFIASICGAYRSTLTPQTSSMALDPCRRTQSCAACRSFRRDVGSLRFSTVTGRFFSAYHHQVDRT